MNRPLTNRDTTIPAQWDRRGLPGWTYHSKALLELEKEELFRRHWQIACHVSNVPEAGDYIAFDFFGERALVIRDREGVVRAFHNMCRHRGSRVVAEESGRCRNAVVCPFHGWVYNLDGTLRGAARPDTFGELDRKDFGLLPVETEIWNGFVFVRFAPGPQPSVAELMQPFADQMAHYDMGNMVRASRIWKQTTPVNWKSVRDVDNEGYHVAMAHPALQDLYGRTYYDEPFVNGVCRSEANCYERGGRMWSVRHYIKLTEPREGMPENLARTWIYYGLFPNAVIAVTPESMQFYQEFPVDVNTTVLRGAVYRHAQENRRQRAARYLATRIDKMTIGEDVQLTIWSNESMVSKAFQGFHLSDLEYGVRTHHDHIREVLPVTTLEEAPDEAEIARLNGEMAA